ncbi:hypothetical protein TL16_g10428 [Triparma laevis f. inornata]|uniref:Uncharacterized protein n=1 Tax=Triparma laevis f. inornata TaxID=1714386 RepID=A0A9W7BH51_9STRA|nr:hypothetical protein TL16_g10428 [Triparma laevis f. inornata]
MILSRFPQLFVPVRVTFTEMIADCAYRLVSKTSTSLGRDAIRIELVLVNTLNESSLLVRRPIMGRGFLVFGNAVFT